MKKPKLPKTDSIQKLAQFWDTHDLTDFEGELKPVTKPVFMRASGGAGSSGRSVGPAINVPLKAREARAIERIAHTRGISSQELVRTWVLKKIAGRTNGSATKR